MKFIYFRIGDRVRLKSGGPEMLIVDLMDRTVMVAWLDNVGHVHEREFPNQCVERSASFFG